MASRAHKIRPNDVHVPACGDLPAYVLRRSDRARRVRLTVTPHEGLVVVVPSRMRGFDPSQTLRDRRIWIERATARFADRRALVLAGPDALLPDDVLLPATDERWGVEYRIGAGKTTNARVDSGLLVVRGSIDDADACREALLRWLQRAAIERLLPLLAEESRRTGLSYTRATVRGQRHRWGSCSSAGSISLNRCLLFLPPELVRAIVLHELAHLAVHDHSKAFWQRLSELDPDTVAHRRATARAWDAVPPWAEP